MKTILTEIVRNDKTRLFNKDYTGVFNKELIDIKEGECFFASPYLGFGDYDNSCNVERSNVRLFLEQFKDSKWVKHWSGAYSSEVILIDVLCDDEEIIEVLESLESYPCIDDEDCYRILMEDEEEMWGNWICRDLKYKIVKHYKADWEDIDEKKLRELYYSLKELANEEYIMEMGGNGYINLDKLCKHLPEEPFSWMKLEYWNL